MSRYGECVEILDELRHRMEDAEGEAIGSCETLEALVHTLVPDYPGDYNHDAIQGFSDVTRRIDNLFMLIVRLCDTEEELRRVLRRERVRRHVKRLRQAMVAEYHRLPPRIRELKHVSALDANSKLAYLSGDFDQPLSVRTRQLARIARNGRPLPVNPATDSDGRLGEEGRNPIPQSCLRPSPPAPGSCHVAD
jgi:hypothetical protein